MTDLIPPQAVAAQSGVRGEMRMGSGLKRPSGRENHRDVFSCTEGRKVDVKTFFLEPNPRDFLPE